MCDAFSFHKLPNITFFRTLSRNNSPFKNNQRPEQHERGKNKKVRHSRKTVSSNEKYFSFVELAYYCWTSLYVDKTVGQLTIVRTPRKL